MAYARGEGVRQDFAEAAKWYYRRAALFDYAPTQHNFANALLNGRGVRRDIDEAVKWFQRAASAGIVESLAVHGAVILAGEVPGDKEQAISKLKRAAEAGNPFGQAILGACYAGLGPTNLAGLLPIDNNEAVRLLRPASTGQPLAQAFLGLLYARGQGVPKDNAEAIQNG